MQADAHLSRHLLKQPAKPHTDLDLGRICCLQMPHAHTTPPQHPLCHSTLFEHRRAHVFRNRRSFSLTSPRLKALKSHTSSASVRRAATSACSCAATLRAARRSLARPRAAGVLPLEDGTSPSAPFPPLDPMAWGDSSLYNGERESVREQVVKATTAWGQHQPR